MMGDILWLLVGAIVGVLLTIPLTWLYQRRDTRTVKWVASPHGLLPTPTDAALRAAREEFAPKPRVMAERIPPATLERLRTLARESQLCGYVWTRRPPCADCGKQEHEHGALGACARYREAAHVGGVRHPDPAAHRCLLRPGHAGRHVCECLTSDPLPQ